MLDQGPCYLQVIQVPDGGRCGVGRSLVHTDTTTSRRALGLAYQANAKTVIRSGFGVFYGRDEDVGINRRLPNNPPWVNLSTFTGDQNAPASLLKNGIPSSALAGGSGNTDVNSFPFDYAHPLRDPVESERAARTAR